MKNSVALAIVFGVFTTFTAHAQQSLPQGIVPLIGETTVRFKPSFEARCSVEQTEKQPGEWFGSRTSWTIITSVLEDAGGSMKYAITTPVESNYFRMILGVKDDGSGFSSDALEFTTNSPLSENDKQDSDKVKDFLLSMMQSYGSLGVGTPLRQGATISLAACSVIPGMTEKSTSGAMSVRGVAVIRGRESVIIAGEQGGGCEFDGLALNFTQKGWHALDVQSGMVTDQSYFTTISVPGKGTLTQTQDSKCLVTGQAVARNSAQPSSPALGAQKPAEQRLTELKSLRDKGLISQEQYEMKRAEIVRGL